MYFGDCSSFACSNLAAVRSSPHHRWFPWTPFRGREILSYLTWRQETSKQKIFDLRMVGTGTFEVGPEPSRWNLLRNVEICKLQQMIVSDETDWESAESHQMAPDWRWWIFLPHLWKKHSNGSFFFFLKMYVHIGKRRVSSGMDHNYKLLSFYILYPLYPSALCMRIYIYTYYCIYIWIYIYVDISSQEGIILHCYCFETHPSDTKKCVKWNFRVLSCCHGWTSHFIWPFMEARTGELWKMMFLFNDEIFRFHPFLFGGILWIPKKSFRNECL